MRLLPLLLLLSASAYGQEARFRDLTEEALKATGVPGAAVAIVHHGRVVMLEGFGLRSVDRAEKVTPDTVFQLASCSKPITATAIAALVGQGKLQFESRIAELDPAFQLNDAWVTGHLTMRDLLSHRSGLPGLAGNELEELGFDGAEILHRLREVPLGNRFRSTYSYSNFGFTEAGEAAARVYGGGFADMLDSLLFRPLGMTSTSARDADFQKAPNRALGHTLQNGRAAQRYTRHPDAQAPAGGVSSTARDLTRFLLLQLGHGEVDGRRIVAEAALTQTWQPVMNTGFNPATFTTGFYGMGWGITYDNRGKPAIAHSGAFSTGSRTLIMLVPDQELGVAVLCNAFPSGLPEGLAQAFVKLATGREADLESVLEKDRQVSQGMQQLVGSDLPARPRNPSPALPEGAYLGEYANGYFGTATVTGGPTLRLGQVAAPLQPWDRDTFLWKVADNETLVRFTIGPEGKAAGLTILESYLPRR